jgi:hypothetical protein
VKDFHAVFMASTLLLAFPFKKANGTTTISFLLSRWEMALVSEIRYPEKLRRDFRIIHQDLYNIRKSFYYA